MCMFVCVFVVIYICCAKVQETSFPPVVSNGKPPPVVLPQSAKNEQVCAKFAPKVDIKLWFSYIQEHNTFFLLVFFFFCMQWFCSGITLFFALSLTQGLTNGLPEMISLKFQRPSLGCPKQPYSSTPLILLSLSSVFLALCQLICINSVALIALLSGPEKD